MKTRKKNRKNRKQSNQKGGSDKNKLLTKAYDATMYVKDVVKDKTIKAGKSVASKVKSKIVNPVVSAGKAVGDKTTSVLELEKCNMDVERTQLDKSLKGNFYYTKKKLKENFNNSKLKEKEKLSVFVKDYLTITLNNFCIKDDRKYLKYCVNLLDCLEDTQKLETYIMKIYNKPKEKQEEYFRNFATFIVNVIIKAIVAYDKKHPSRHSFITIKKGLCRLFGSDGLDIIQNSEGCKDTIPPNMKNVTVEQIVTQLNNETTEAKIQKLLVKELTKDDSIGGKKSGLSSIKRKDNKQSTAYPLILIGTIFFSSLLFMNVLDTPPGVTPKHGTI